MYYYEEKTDEENEIEQERLDHQALTVEDCEEDRNSAKYLRKLFNKREEY